LGELFSTTNFPTFVCLVLLALAAAITSAAIAALHPAIPSPAPFSLLLPLAAIAARHFSGSTKAIAWDKRLNCLT
jgi:hypothetical protein